MAAGDSAAPMLGDSPQADVPQSAPQAKAPNAAPNDQKEDRIKKLLNLCLQFQPYVIIWWSLWIIVNDYIKTHCNAKIELCYVPDWQRDTMEFDGPYYDGTARSRDLISCPFAFTFDNPPQGSFPFLSIFIAAMVITCSCITTQFVVLYCKVASAKYGSLSYIVWLEMAKEPGSMFYRLTQVTGAILLIVSVASIINGGLKYSEGDVLMSDLFFIVFATFSSMSTIWGFLTYDSPVATFAHAHQCPNIQIQYRSWDMSNKVMVRIHHILSLDRDVARLFIASGDEDKVQQQLEESSMTHLDPKILASLGKGKAAEARLEAIRHYFSNPPDEEEEARLMEMLRKDRRKSEAKSLAGQVQEDPPPTVSQLLTQLEDLEACMEKEKAELESKTELLKLREQQLKELQAHGMRERGEFMRQKRELDRELATEVGRCDEMTVEAKAAARMRERAADAARRRLERCTGAGQETDLYEYAEHTGASPPRAAEQARPATREVTRSTVAPLLAPPSRLHRPPPGGGGGGGGGGAWAAPYSRVQTAPAAGGGPPRRPGARPGSRAQL